MINSRSIPIRLTGAAFLVGLSVHADAEERMSVAAEDVVRRTCPSVRCGVIGRFFVGESVVVYETVNGWSRVSGYYSAGCHDGQSAFVETGSSACTEANGIVRGEFAEWVKTEFLAADTSNQPS